MDFFFFFCTSFYNFRLTRKGVKIDKKNGKTPGQDKINSELHNYAHEEYKLKLLQFLNNIHRKIAFQIIEKCRFNPNI
jgi:hypothetical protein